jgi:hypothetical protein
LSEETPCLIDASQFGVSLDSAVIPVRQQSSVTQCAGSSAVATEH